MKPRHNYLELLQNKRAETERELNEANAIANPISREKAIRKIKATQEKISSLETRFLQIDDLPRLHPDKTEGQIKRMGVNIKEQILRLTDAKAHKKYNDRAKESAKRQRDDNDERDESQKPGTEANRLAKVAYWERRLENAETKEEKQMAVKRIRYFKKTDEERKAIKKQGAEAQQRYAERKEVDKLRQELDNAAQAAPAPAPVKKIKVKAVTEASVVKVTSTHQAAVPAEDILPPPPVASMVFDLKAIDFGDVDCGSDLDEEIRAAFSSSNFNLWNSRKQNAGQTPAQDATPSESKKQRME